MLLLGRKIKLEYLTENYYGYITGVVDSIRKLLKEQFTSKVSEKDGNGDKEKVEDQHRSANVECRHGSSNAEKYWNKEQVHFIGADIFDGKCIRFRKEIAGGLLNTVESIERRLKELELCYTNFLNNNALTTELHDKYTSIADSLEGMRDDLASNLKKKEKFGSNVQSKPIEIESFNGRMDDWQSFYELFMQVIGGSGANIRGGAELRLKALLRGKAK